jgi:polyferredoxin
VPIADFVLALHALVVIFNVGGLLVVLIGGPLGWRWVRRRGFRIAHVALMTFVTAEAMLGMTCPLTVLEDWLRGVANEQSFVQRFASALIYWNAPPWMFALLYAVFLLAVVGAWVAWPPAAKNTQSPRG